MPNVREILELLRDRTDIRSYLLTGNTRAGARAKLTHYDLMQYFPDGAFAEDTGDRASIARRALDGERQFLSTVFGMAVTDAPRDVEAIEIVNLPAAADVGRSVHFAKGALAEELVQREG